MRVGGCPVAVAKWQSTGVLSSTPGGCQPFHFPQFSPYNIFIEYHRFVTQAVLAIQYLNTKMTVRDCMTSEMFCISLVIQVHP